MIRWQLPFCLAIIASLRVDAKDNLVLYYPARPELYAERMVRDFSRDAPSKVIGRMPNAPSVGLVDLRSEDVKLVSQAGAEVSPPVRFLAPPPPPPPPLRSPPPPPSSPALRTLSPFPLPRLVGSGLRSPLPSTVHVPARLDESATLPPFIKISSLKADQKTDEKIGALIQPADTPEDGGPPLPINVPKQRSLISAADPPADGLPPVNKVHQLEGPDYGAYDTKETKEINELYDDEQSINTKKAAAKVRDSALPKPLDLTAAVNGRGFGQQVKKILPPLPPLPKNTFQTKASSKVKARANAIYKPRPKVVDNSARTKSATVVVTPQLSLGSLKRRGNSRRLEPFDGIRRHQPIGKTISGGNWQKPGRTALVQLDNDAIVQRARRHRRTAVHDGEVRPLGTAYVTELK